MLLEPPSKSPERTGSSELAGVNMSILNQPFRIILVLANWLQFYPIAAHSDETPFRTIKGQPRGSLFNFNQSEVNLTFHRNLDLAI